MTATKNFQNESAEVYSESCQTFKMKICPKKIKPLTTFVKGYKYKCTLRYDKIAR